MSLLIKPTTDQIMCTSSGLLALMVEMTSSYFLHEVYFFRQAIYNFINQCVENTCTTYNVAGNPSQEGWLGKL